jgi:hypothetical protein
MPWLARRPLLDEPRPFADSVAAWAMMVRMHTTVGVDEAGVIGTFSVPDGPGPHPGVVALSGSGGGVPSWWGELLAPHGIAVLAAAYVGIEPLPSAICEIPVETVATAGRRCRHPRRARCRTTAAPVWRPGCSVTLDGDGPDHRRPDEGPWPKRRRPPPRLPRVRPCRRTALAAGTRTADAVRQRGNRRCPRRRPRGGTARRRTPPQRAPLTYTGVAAPPSERTTFRGGHRWASAVRQRAAPGGR